MVGFIECINSMSEIVVNMLKTVNLGFRKVAVVKLTTDNEGGD